MSGQMYEKKSLTSWRSSRRNEPYGVRLTGVVRDPEGYLYGFMCRLPDCASLPPAYNRKLGDTGRFKYPSPPGVRVVFRWKNRPSSEVRVPGMRWLSNRQLG